MQPRLRGLVRVIAGIAHQSASSIDCRC